MDDAWAMPTASLDHECLTIAAAARRLDVTIRHRIKRGTLQTQRRT
jgi:hypothetical protein